MKAVLVMFLIGVVACQASPSSGSTKSLTAQVFIQAEYKVVWASFTDANLYEPWFSAPCSEFGDEPGDRIVWADHLRTYYVGELLAIEHGVGLSFTLQFQDFGFHEPASPVRIRIEEHGATVLVDLVDDCSASPKTAQMISDVGWTKSLSRLKTLLETGHQMTWPE